MPTLAVARLYDVHMSPDIIEYLERIDATLAPFDAHFLVHGGEKEMLEGDWQGDLIIIEFPDREKARQWYRSPAYQDIVKLRTDHAKGDIIFIETVSRDHRATDILQ